MSDFGPDRKVLVEAWTYSGEVNAFGELAIGFRAADGSEGESTYVDASTVRPVPPVWDRGLPDGVGVTTIREVREHGLWWRSPVMNLHEVHTVADDPDEWVIGVGAYENANTLVWAREPIPEPATITVPAGATDEQVLAAYREAVDR